MARPCFCRFCGHPAQIIAGVFPLSCEKCDGADHWSTQPPAAYLEPPKHKKRARVKMDLTAPGSEALTAVADRGELRRVGGGLGT